MRCSFFSVLTLLFSYLGITDSWAGMMGPAYPFNNGGFQNGNNNGYQSNVYIYNNSPSPFANNGSLMVSGGSYQGLITSVPSGYDPNMNFGNATPTGIMVGGGSPPMLGANPMNLGVPGPGNPMGLQYMTNNPGMNFTGIGGPQYAPNWNAGSMLAPPVGAMMGAGMPGQVSQWNLNAQLGPNAAYIANTTGTTGTLGAMNWGVGGMSPYAPNPYTPNPYTPINNGAQINNGGAADPFASIIATMQNMPGMSGGMSDMMTAMLAQSPGYQKMQAQKSAGSFRIVRGLTNTVLASKSQMDLERYQRDLEDLVSVSPEYFPSNVEASDIDLQLSRVNLALTDPSTLLLSPNATSLPDLGLRQERVKRLNVLLDKWSTPNGLADTNTNLGTPRTRTPITARTRVGGFTSTTATTFEYLQNRIETISFDERQLTQSKTEVNTRNDSDTLRRIEQALYNTLIAKAKLYDNIMDSIQVADWENLIDNWRSIGPAKSATTFRGASSSRVAGRTSGAPLLASTASLAASTIPSANPLFQLSKDEVIALKTDLQGVLSGMQDHKDHAQGGDRALVKQLETHVKTVDGVLNAMNNASLPNPFRTSQNAVMQQIYNIHGAIAGLSDKDLYAQLPATLQDYRDKLDAALRTPAAKLPPELTYAQTQAVVDKLIKILAVQVYQEEDNDRQALTQGSTVRRTVGSLRSLGSGRGAKDISSTAALVTYLKNGAFNRGGGLSIEDVPSRADVMMLVGTMNKLYITGDKSIWTAVAAQQDRRNKAKVALESLSRLESVGGNLNSIKNTNQLKSMPLSALRGVWGELLDYYYNMDYGIWPTEKQIKAATTQQASGRPGVSRAPSSSLLSLFDRKKQENEAKKEQEEEKTGGEKNANENVINAHRKTSSKNEETEEVLNEEEILAEFLKDKTRLENLIRIIEQAIASTFVKHKFAKNMKANDMGKAIPILQDAYSIQYSGFLDRGSLEQIESFTTTLVENIDKIRSES